MIIYLIVFTIALLLLKRSIVQNHFSKTLCYFGALFLPVMLAALRAPSIGTDTSDYLTLFHVASTNNLSYSDFIDTYSGFEQGFALLVYLCGKLFTDEIYFLFICHSLIILPFFYAVLKWGNGKTITLSLFIFFFLFYNESLNLMRQYIALSFTILSVMFLFQRKTTKALLFLLFSVSFHNTAMLILVIFAIFYLTKVLPIKKHGIVYSILLVLGICALSNLAFYIDNVSKLFLTDNYAEKYAVNFKNSKGATSSLSTMIIYGMILIFFFSRRRNKSCAMLDFFFIMALMAFLFNFLSVYSVTLYRLSLYFNIFSCISIPLYIRDQKGQPTLWSPILYGLFIFYWIFAVVIHGSNETYPYSSIILSFLNDV